MSRIAVMAGLLAAAGVGALWWSAELHRVHDAPIPRVHDTPIPHTDAGVVTRPTEVGLLTSAHAVRAVRASLTRFGDSLRIVTAWDGPRDAVRLRLDPAGGRAIERRRTTPGTADTFYLPSPVPGQTAHGTACVDAGGGAGEMCTPWQFVRPSAAPRVAAGGANGRGVQVVVRPDGMQVDPDVDGRCAAWRAAHPEASGWIAVNETAVPACTGPNGRPTIAQFCAFAILPDGRKVKTGGSSNNPYCEEEFERWLAERAS